MKEFHLVCSVLCHIRSKLGQEKVSAAPDERKRKCCCQERRKPVLYPMMDEESALLQKRRNLRCCPRGKKTVLLSVRIVMREQIILDWQMMTLWRQIAFDQRFLNEYKIIAWHLNLVSLHEWKNKFKEQRAMVLIHWRAGLLLPVSMLMLIESAQCRGIVILTRWSALIDDDVQTCCLPDRIQNMMRNHRYTLMISLDSKESHNSWWQADL